MNRLLIASLLLLVSGCVPMVLSVYAPMDGTGREVGHCGWSNISVLLLEQQGVRVTAGFQSSSGLGAYALGVTVAEGTTLEFDVPDLQFSSPELVNPISLRFVSYERGSAIPITRVVGPQQLRLAIVPTPTPRPREVLVSLPATKINGKAVYSSAVQLRLQNSAAVVGLCHERPGG